VDGARRAAPVVVLAPVGAIHIVLMGYAIVMCPWAVAAPRPFAPSVDIAASVPAPDACAANYILAWLDIVAYLVISFLPHPNILWWGWCQYHYI